MASQMEKNAAAAAVSVPASEGSVTDETAGTGGGGAAEGTNGSQSSQADNVYSEMYKQIAAQQEMMKTLMETHTTQLLKMQEMQTQRQVYYEEKLAEILVEARKIKTKDEELPKLISVKDTTIDEKFAGNRNKWSEFAEKLKTLLHGIHQKYAEALDWAEQIDEKSLTMEDIKAKDIDYATASAQIFGKLSTYTTGEPFTMVSNAKDKNGLLAWRRLVRYFDPNNAITRRSLLGQILNPGPAGSYEKLNGHLESWIDKKQRYERMSQKEIEEEYLIGIVVEMCPGALKEHLETNAERLNTYKEVYEEVLRHLERHLSKKANSKSGDSKGSLCDMEVHHEEENHSSYGGHYLNTVGNQKGKGKGGVLTCYTCGGVGHPARLCPSQTPIQPGAITCKGCGGKGHYQSQCPSIGGGGKGSKSGQGKGQWQQGGKGKGFHGKGFGKGGWKGQGPKGGQVSELGSKSPPEEPWMNGAHACAGHDGQEWQQQCWHNHSAINHLDYSGGSMIAARDGWGDGPLRMSSVIRKHPLQTANRFGILSREEREEERQEDNQDWNAQVKVSFRSQKESQRTIKRRVRQAKVDHDLENLIKFIEEGPPGIGRPDSDSNVAGKGKESKPLYPLTKIVGSRTVSQLNSNQSSGCWRELEVTVDSGACETVMPEEACDHIKITPSLQSMRGDAYEVANGETVPNLGERKCIAMTSGSQVPKQITFQCAEIHKPLLSTACAADAGYETRLQRRGGYLEHVDTGDKIPIYRRDNLYFIKMWVKGQPESGEQRQGNSSGFVGQER